VVRPHDERQNRDRRGGIHHGGIAEQSFLRANAGTIWLMMPKAGKIMM
jgi:hypothetical protein